MAHRYLFYDLETTGLNVAFDQVLQFAGITTDEALNVIDEEEIRIRLRPDVIPAPEAVLTHLITPTMMKTGTCEYEGISRIHQLLNAPNTLSLGYNTLSFDDEFLRFSFYRNLLTPYTHQYANSCRRLDIYPITILFYLFGKTALTWPEVNARISLKLEALNEANQLASGQAHDAMVDVRATIALAKKLRAHQDMWQYAVGYFEKNIDSQRLAQLPYAFNDTEHREAVLIHSQFGYKNNFQAIAICLGQHRHYKNQLCWLRLDLPELTLAKQDNFVDHTWVVKKKPGEPPFTLPTSERFLKHFTAEQLDCVAKNKKYLAENPCLLKSITDHYLDFKFPVVPEADVDSVLYQNGFMSYHDQNIAQNFHQANINQKINFIDDFQDEDLKTLAIRLLGRNYPDSLTGDYRAQFQQYMQNPFKAIDCQKRDKLTPPAALARLDTLETNNDDLKNALNMLYQSY